MSAELIIKEIQKLPATERDVVRDYILSSTQPKTDSRLITKARENSKLLEKKSRDELFSELEEVLEKINP